MVRWKLCGTNPLIGDAQPEAAPALSGVGFVLLLVFLAVVGLRQSKLRLPRQEAN